MWGTDACMENGVHVAQFNSTQSEAATAEHVVFLSSPDDWSWPHGLDRMLLMIMQVSCMLFIVCFAVCCSADLL